MLDINKLSDDEYTKYIKAIVEQKNMNDREKYNGVVRNPETIWEVLGE